MPDGLHTGTHHNDHRMEADPLSYLEEASVYHYLSVVYADLHSDLYRVSVLKGRMETDQAREESDSGSDHGK